MKRREMVTAVTLISALISAPALAEDRDNRPDRPNYDKQKYKEHFQARHMMDMDMMKALKETMSILKDLNHQPNAEEKKRLAEMIKQMEELMNQRSEMDKRAMRHMDEYARERSEAPPPPRRD